MKKLIMTIALALLVMANACPVYAHGDDEDHEPAQVQTPAETTAATHAPDALPMEIIPNWHPIFVHFTIALLFTATLLFLVGKAAPVTASWRATCITVARWNLSLGVLITLGTILAGWYAFNTVNHDNFSHQPMLSHRLWALSTAGAFIILALWSFTTRCNEPHLLFILCLLAASCALAVTGYKGGELVYRHGLGVMSMPQMDDHMHHHGSIQTMPEMHEDHDHHD